MYVGKISWWMSQNFSKKEYLDTYFMDAKFQILKFHTLKFRPKFPQNFVTPILYIETSNVRMSRENLPDKNKYGYPPRYFVGDAIKSTITYHTLSRTGQELELEEGWADSLDF